MLTCCKLFCKIIVNYRGRNYVYFRNLIVDLALRHGIRHVFIIARKCVPDILGTFGSWQHYSLNELYTSGSFSDAFLIKLCKMDMTVSIYENRFDPMVQKYFERPLQFWNGLSRDLQKDGILFNLSHCHEPGFRENNGLSMNTYVRTIIRCKPDDPSVQFPTLKSRGFYKP